MPAGIIDAVCTYVSQNYNNGAGVTVWDGEVHRYDPSGDTVSPESSGGIQDWPVVRFFMEKRAFKRAWTFEDPYYDQGLLVCQIFHNTRALAEYTMDQIELLLASITNWAAISALIPANAYPTQNKPYIIQMLLLDWTSYQIEGARTEGGSLIYTCELYYDTWLHGAVPTN